MTEGSEGGESRPAGCAVGKVGVDRLRRNFTGKNDLILLISDSQCATITTCHRKDSIFKKSTFIH